MNKRFSTLLAGVLLAGGTFSVQTVSADEAALLKSLGKYYQVEVATDKYLVIGQGEMGLLILRGAIFVIALLLAARVFKFLQ